MAADNPNVVNFELEASPQFTLVMSSSGKVELLVDGQSAVPDLPGAKIDRETRDVTIMGRDAGKLAASEDLEDIASTFESWFPSRVHHVHDEADYNSKKSSGIVVVKFSATWCGPCKMAAPKVDAMSLSYPDVQFLHVDGDENKAIFQREGAKAYPTFFFYHNGVKQGDKIEGADLKKVEAVIKRLGAQEVAVEKNCAERRIDLKMARDAFIVEKEDGGVSLTVNGKKIAPAGKCPMISVNRQKGSIHIGGQGGQIWVGGETDLEAIMSTLEEFFPTKVKHVHTEAEFDEIVRNNKHVVAKFSADWCGPCHRIAPVFTELSNKHENVVFLHIDVDDAKSLSQRESIEAMPTFLFYENGAKNTSKTVRGANGPDLKSKVEGLQ